GHGHHALLHPFPTRRSSDLNWQCSLRNRHFFGKGEGCSISFATASPALKKPKTSCKTSSTSLLPVMIPLSRSTGSRRGCSRWPRSEEHTSELQSRENLVCRL